MKVRRHHCRNCCRVVCAECSTNRLSLPSQGYVQPARVCDLCYTFLVGYQMPSKSKLAYTTSSQNLLNQIEREPEMTLSGEHRAQLKLARRMTHLKYAGASVPGKRRDNEDRVAIDFCEEVLHLYLFHTPKCLFAVVCNFKCGCTVYCFVLKVATGKPTTTYILSKQKNRKKITEERTCTPGHIITDIRPFSLTGEKQRPNRTDAVFWCIRRSQWLWLR